jgi:hypothetical protein
MARLSKREQKRKQVHAWLQRKVGLIRSQWLLEGGAWGLE